MKGYSTFPKAPALMEPHHQIVWLKKKKKKKKKRKKLGENSEIKIICICYIEKEIFALFTLCKT